MFINCSLETSCMFYHRSFWHDEGIPFLHCWLVYIRARLRLEFSYVNKSLKYGLCKKLLLSECNSDQLNISSPFLSSLLGGCNSKATPNPPKSDEKNGREMFNWSELLLGRSNFLQNPYFSLAADYSFEFGTM